MMDRVQQDIYQVEEGEVAATIRFRVIPCMVEKAGMDMHRLNLSFQL